jgi:hypothetical protein
MPAQYNNKKGNDIEAYLAGIRKTIADSNAVVAQAELRIQETDRMLAQQGLTREQVLAMQFSEDQVRAANEELKRRGMEPLDNESIAMLTQPHNQVDSSVPDAAPGPPIGEADAATGTELENRQRKFGMMMKPFQI